MSRSSSWKGDDVAGALLAAGLIAAAHVTEGYRGGSEGRGVGETARSSAANHIGSRVKVVIGGQTFFFTPDQAQEWQRIRSQPLAAQRQWLSNVKAKENFALVAGGLAAAGSALGGLIGRTTSTNNHQDDDIVDVQHACRTTWCAKRGHISPFPNQKRWWMNKKGPWPTECPFFTRTESGKWQPCRQRTLDDDRDAQVGAHVLYPPGSMNMCIVPCCKHHNNAALMNKRGGHVMKVSLSMCASNPDCVCGEYHPEFNPDHENNERRKAYRTESAYSLGFRAHTH